MTNNGGASLVLFFIPLADVKTVDWRIFFHVVLEMLAILEHGTPPRCSQKFVSCCHFGKFMKTS